jgi:hypothetical protein
LEPEAVILLQAKKLQGLEAPLHDLMLPVKAQAVQGQEGVDHGRLNAAPIAAVLLMFQDPLLRSPDG